MTLTDATAQAELLRRLRCAEGHLHSVADMLERGLEAETVLGQLLAVQGALRQVALRLIERQLAELLRSGLPAPTSEQRQRVIASVMNMYAVVGAWPRLAAGQGDKSP